MNKIYLTKGFVTKVDDEDFEKLSKFSWYAISRDNTNYYAARKQNNKLTYLAREIMNASKNFEVDHINGDTLDNQKCNLRICTKGQNQRNRHSKRKNCSSKYVGVTFITKENKWRAQISVNKKPINLGRFKTEEEAYEARKKAVIKYWDYPVSGQAWIIK